MYVCMYVCMYVLKYVCMYVCMYVMLQECNIFPVGAALLLVEPTARAWTIRESPCDLCFSCERCMCMYMIHISCTCMFQ